MYEIINKEYFENLGIDIVANGYFSPVFYCPLCGHIDFIAEEEKQVKCKHCLQITNLRKSIHPYIYYADNSVTKFGDSHRWNSNSILVEEEASKNEEFQQMLHDYKPPIRIPKPQQNTNVPKCPTCGSTNIESISFSKRAANTVLFGLVSKTARSQFHCKSCGYKW